MQKLYILEITWMPGPPKRNFFFANKKKNKAIHSV